MEKNCQGILEAGLEAALSAYAATVRAMGPGIIQAAEMAARCMGEGGKIAFFGNGGSAADSQHLAAEFVNRFKMERRPLPAVALTTDTSILTSIANDYDFEEVFSKQVRALLGPGDMAVGISTSGTSPNVLKALREARTLGARTLGLSGENTSRMNEVCDLVLGVQSSDTPRIQEVHIFMGHMICEMVERILFSP